MAFDPARYREAYLLPKARLKLTSLPDDLLERYAISLPTTDADIASTVRAVRASWSSQQAGSLTAKFAKLCIGADHDLKSTHGDRMLSAKWWEEQAAKQQKAASQAVTQLAELLKESHGVFGYLTQSYLDGCATTLGIGTEQAVQAASQAGLEVLPSDLLPVKAPISDAQYATLEGQMAMAGAFTLVHLLHPEAKNFSIVRGFSVPSKADARLDGDAVGTQLVRAEKLQVSPANDARREALRFLKSVAKDKHLHQLALHNLAQLARRSSNLGIAGVRQQLVKVGLTATDAAALAVLTSGAGPSDAVIGPARIETLLAEGRLREATQAANELPSTFKDERARLIARVETARACYDQLIKEALELLAIPDEVTALSRVRDAAAISADEAEQVLATIPLAPPSAPIAGVEENTAHIHWKPNLGHSEDTTYVVRRGENVAPTSVVEGIGVFTGKSHEASDQQVAVARVLYYSVFATAPGRPASRSATTTLIVAPPVVDLKADIGPDHVTFRWSGHPHVYRFIATQRLADGQRSTRDVINNSVRLVGLPEGQPVSIEVIAEYQAPDGRPLRSEPRDISAIPRSRARPIEAIRARPAASGGDSNVAINWARVDNSDVRIRRSKSPSPWPPGTWIESDDFTGFGCEVSGRITNRGNDVTLEASVPEGQIHHIVAFSIGGTGIVVGRSTVIGVTEPVKRLGVQQFSGYAKLTWIWPDGSTLAEVTWESDGSDKDAVGVEKVKLSEYDRNGGFNVPLGQGDTVVEVRSLMVVGDSAIGSSPVQVVVKASRASKVQYSVESSPRLGPLGGRTKRFIFEADTPITGARLRIVATQGLVMPSSEDGSTLLTEIELALRPGTKHVETVSIPKYIGRPYWVRCFAADDRLELLDPPINALKET
ncbi:hypothetical protein E7Z53_18190 [Kocuria salina]|uniref:hypothetical protein n=1 Tax=Kocuria salina TaxID=1929416 RepID=UPI001593CD95|nr:hypothetical protein [Kocuria salina]NVC25349.1 hypothetical protein [Kocuria salina]